MIFEKLIRWKCFKENHFYFILLFIVNRSWVRIEMSYNMQLTLKAKLDIQICQGTFLTRMFGNWDGNNKDKENSKNCQHTQARNFEIQESFWEKETKANVDKKNRKTVTIKFTFIICMNERKICFNRKSEVVVKTFQ